MKHTPGPWHVELSNANASHEIRGPDKEGIAYTGIWRLEHREEQTANAHLIAAAPDLLAAAKRSLQYLHLAYRDGKEAGLDEATLEHCRRDFEMIQTAIKQAEGET